MSTREDLEKVLLNIADGNQQKAIKYSLMLDNDLNLAEMAHKAKDWDSIQKLREALDAQTGYGFYVNE